MATSLNIQYNIPRVQIQLPGRQNRLASGEFRITPSMAEPVIFMFGNQDGVPLNLLPFEIRFVVWDHEDVGTRDIEMGQSEIVLNKSVPVADPYSGQIEMLLTGDETFALGQRSIGSDLRWSLFMINSDGEVFPVQVSTSGSRSGYLKVDHASGMPIAELIKSPRA